MKMCVKLYIYKYIYILSHGELNEGSSILGCYSSLTIGMEEMRKYMENDARRKPWTIVRTTDEERIYERGCDILSLDR